MVSLWSPCGVPVESRSKVRLYPVLGGDEPQFFQSRDLGLSELVIREVLERISSPQRQRLAQVFARGHRVELQASAATFHCPLEMNCVYVGWIDM